MTVCEGIFTMPSHRLQKNQQANRTSWTDGAHSALLTAQFCIYSLISPVSRNQRVMQKCCVIAVFCRTCSVQTSQPSWPLSDRRIHRKWLVGIEKDEGKCGAAFPLLLASLPSSVRVFVFQTEINCSLFINLLMVGNCFWLPPPPHPPSSPHSCSSILYAAPELSACCQSNVSARRCCISNIQSSKFHLPSNHINSQQ